jgi:hypothetical protein
MYGMQKNVTTQYAIPVYMHSYPNRPYNVIGYLDVVFS